MLNVLQLIPTLDRSGAEKQMVLLAAGLPRDRFHVEVGVLTRAGPLEADLKAAGIPLTRLGKRHKVDPFALNRLVRLLRDRKFDIVQTWIFAANVYGRLAARRANVPIIVTAEMAVDLWKSRAHLEIDRRLARWTDRIVGNSRAVVDFYRERAGIPAERLEVIYSGIGDEPCRAGDPAATRAELGVEPGVPVALFAGRLAPQKAVDDLLRALDLLQHVRGDLVTWIAGDGPERERLEERARAFQLGSRVRFLGHRGDVPRLIAAADLVVLPSRYEGLPNIVLEAMKAGKPVVATAAPGTTELVVDGETGRLVPIGQPPALAQAIRTVVEAPDLARRYGDAGRARVEAAFRVDQMVDRFATLYHTLARRKGLIP